MEQAETHTKWATAPICAKRWYKLMQNKDKISEAHTFRELAELAGITSGIQNSSSYARQLIKSGCVVATPLPRAKRKGRRGPTPARWNFTLTGKEPIAVSHTQTKKAEQKLELVVGTERGTCSVHITVRKGRKTTEVSIINATTEMIMEILNNRIK